MAATSTGMARLESFPFDSKADGYDAEGYPVYDRAVGAYMLRETFAKFFTNGIFPNPGTALNIGKADTGLAVTIQPGIGIINGSMGGVTGDDALTVTLDSAPPQGNVCYAVMLRFDNTDGFADSRSLLINVVRSDAATSPTPPTPDTTTPQVFELRLGYVSVPSGATDLSEATVTNEKGLDVCPYAAPFEKIDMSEVTADARASANEALTALLAYFESNREAIDAALSGEEATHLQQQITALQEQLADLDIDLASEVDNTTIEYTGTDNPVDPKKLRVKDGGIGTSKIADGAVTVQKVGSGVITFTDDASSMQDASDRVAATPKLVDSKIWDPRSCSAELTKVANVGTGEYLSMTNVTVSGFTKDSNSITAPYKILAFVYISVFISQHTGPFNIRVNGSTVVTISSTGGFYYMLELDAGDKVQVYNSISTTYNQVTDFRMNGV